MSQPWQPDHQSISSRKEQTNDGSRRVSLTLAQQASCLLLRHFPHTSNINLALTMQQRCHDNAATVRDTYRSRLFHGMTALLLRRKHTFKPTLLDRQNRGLQEGLATPTGAPYWSSRPLRPPSSMGIGQVCCQ